MRSNPNVYYRLRKSVGTKGVGQSLAIVLFALSPSIYGQTHAEFRVETVLKTIAGSDWVGDGGPARDALLQQAEGLAIDGQGNLYIADAAAHRVRRIAPDGVIETVAGNGHAGFSGDEGPATDAMLNAPYDVALDPSGHLYIADLGNARVRKVDLDGVITTVAGGGSAEPGGIGDGADATTVVLGSPRNLAYGPSGNLYISDFSGHRVLRLNPAGALWTVAGTGTAGFQGEGSSARQAQLSHPAGLAVDASGVLYIADSQNRWVRKVENGVIENMTPVSLPIGLGFAADGTLLVADAGGGQIVRIHPNGPGDGILNVLPHAVRDVVAATDGTLYMAQGTRLLRRSGNSVTQFAGGGDPARGDFGPAIEALLNVPTGVASGPDGSVYIADRENHRVRKVDPEGVITTLAGYGIAGSSGDGGPTTRAALNLPEAVNLDADGNLYIADTGNRRVRRITPEGIIEAVNLGAPEGFVPRFVLADSVGNLCVAGEDSILRSDGQGAAAVILEDLANPGGMVLDPQGNLYIAETDGGRVLRLSKDGALMEIGGEPSPWVAPRSVAIGADGTLYVADAGRAQILKVPFAEDGTPGIAEVALEQGLALPWDLAVGPLGELLIADAGSNRVQRLTQQIIADPVIQLSVVHAATREPGPVAPGMLAFVRGVTVEEPLVRVAGFDAQLLSASSGELLIRMPVELISFDAGASALSPTLEVFEGEKKIAEVPVQIASAAPALFIGEDGHAIALNEDGTLNSPEVPAKRGSIVVLYGTGEGVGLEEVRVRVGFTDAGILYSGPVEGNPGLWQINVRLPSGFVPPGSLRIDVFVGDVMSPVTYIHLM